jgi:hypothetical protein
MDSAFQKQSLCPVELDLLFFVLLIKSVATEFDAADFLDSFDRALAKFNKDNLPESIDETRTPFQTTIYVADFFGHYRMQMVLSNGEFKPFHVYDLDNPLLGPEPTGGT